LAARRIVVSNTGARAPDSSSRVVSETLYKNDIRPEMTWLISGVPLGLTLASPAVIWAAVLGWRRYGHVVARWVCACSRFEIQF
jgi:hypothetical protein